MSTVTDGELFYKISEGHRPMPSFKKRFTEEQRWQLVDAAAQEFDHVQGRLIGPMDIFDDDDRQRRRPLQLIEQGREDRGAAGLRTEELG